MRAATLTLLLCIPHCAAGAVASLNEGNWDAELAASPSGLFVKFFAPWVGNRC